MDHNLFKIMNPFDKPPDDDSEDAIPDVSTFWLTFLTFEGGKPVMLTEHFFANVWPDFWPHVTKRATRLISEHILTNLGRNLRRATLQNWLTHTSKLISDWLGWDNKLFTCFPWVWTSIDHSIMNNTLKKYSGTGFKPVSEWMVQWPSSQEARSEIKQLETKINELISLKSRFLKKLPTKEEEEYKLCLVQLREIDEELLNPMEKFIVRRLKLTVNAYREEEIPKLKALDVVKQMIRELKKEDRRGEDHTLLFRLGCDDSKTNQWLSIMKYKGFVGEMIFSEHFGDIYDEMPEEQKNIDGIPIFKRNSNVEYISEFSKPSIREIIESVAENNYVDVVLPDFIPLYFPDFYVSQVSEEGAVFLTLFECTWSRNNSVKTVNDQLKWEKFVTEFNKLNHKPGRDDIEFQERFMMLYVRTINVNLFVRRKKANQSLSIRINAVEKLINLYFQGVLSLDNPNVMQTIDISKTLRFPKEVPRNYNIPKEILKELESKVNDDVKKDTGIGDYVSKLEKLPTKDEVEEFEEKLMEKMSETFTKKFAETQRKWVLTTSEDLHKGVDSICESFFNRDTVKRLIQNNHHDDNQFTMINEGEDLTHIVQSTFNKISDIMEAMTDIQTAKLKPILCMAVHASAGHTTYLSNNYQFGPCKGLDNKTNKMNRLTKFLNQKFPNDPRVEAITNYNQKKVTNSAVWVTGEYSLSEYKTHVDPVLERLIRKKNDNDYVYRYTDSTNADLINEFNYEAVKDVCCPDMVVRFEHMYNEVIMACPTCNKRFRCVEPFCQLDSIIDELEEESKSSCWSKKMVNHFLIKLLDDDSRKLNIFLISHILHFLIGETDKGQKIVNLINKHLFKCHPYYQELILGTLRKKNLSEKCKSIVLKSGLISSFRDIESVRIRKSASQIATSWYLNNLKYVIDPISRELLEREIESLVETNPYVMCLADLAEKLILARSQHFALGNAVGYVTFSPSFGAIFSSGSDPNSESIKSFGLSTGHFFINHRTLRMMQGLPLMLISNKLLVDKMAKRPCNPGIYRKDDLVQFCMLNSRRMNVNLQNIRYFFMACWSNVHSPKLFKKLEMKFLKTSELKLCSKILNYMQNVVRNYDYLNSEVRQTKMPDQVVSSFPVLFNEGINASLNDTDLCLHSFYMVHLFEKTISGKVQEIRKVFEKFLKPKEAWMADRKKFLEGCEDPDLTARFLRSDGLCEDFDKVFELTLKDMLEHTNKYSGFDMMFIKAAAMRFDGFNKDEFATEIRMPNALTDLLKATSTLRKFEPSVNFNRVCKAIDTKAKIENAMKKTNDNLIEFLKEFDKDETVAKMFPKCCEVLNNIKRKDAVDLTDEETITLRPLVCSLDITNLNKDSIDKLDDALSKTQFVQICENFCERRHKMRNRADELSNLFGTFKTEFPNAFSLHEMNPVLSLLLFCDHLKWSLEELNEGLEEIDNSAGSITSNDLRKSLLLSSLIKFNKDPNFFIQHLFSSLDKDRTPKNRRLKKMVQKCTQFLANPRSMTTALINDILNLMNDDVFSDVYTICATFKFNCDPIIFAMAFKEQFGGERELTIGNIWSKLTLKLVEDIARDLGRCMKNSCLNAPDNETIFKEMITKTQQSNKFFTDKSEIGEATPNQFWSLDRSKWGPFHQGLAFYTVIRILLTGSASKTEDVVDVVKYSCMKHALKHFEIHHNIITSVLKKAMRKGCVYEENNQWFFNLQSDRRPDIELSGWEIFVIHELMMGRKSIHTRMDMGQGMLHSCSDVYGAVIDNYITNLTKVFFKRNFNVDYQNTSMNTSDDSASILQFSGKDSFKNTNLFIVLEILIKDFLQRLSNMYLAEKSLGSDKIIEFKSSFMIYGEQIRVLIKFLSTQLTIGKDCLPEDYFNSYNSLSKQILCNGGSQMMCDLLYLSKLHQMQSVYTLSKTIFEDCVRDATPGRFGFPNLTCPDIYYHTSRHIMANRTVDFLHLCGFTEDVLNIKVTKPNGEAKSRKLRVSDERELPDDFISHNGTKYETQKTGESYETRIRLSGGRNDLILYHQDLLNTKTLQENLVKYYTLARTPGSSPTETMYCGVSTLIPSQRGKSQLLEDLEHKSLRNMSYLNHFIMRYMPKTLKSAKMRTTQALYQSLNEEAKRAHQNMVYAKGKLINRGNFCFLGGRLVDQKTAFNNFNCDDGEFKCVLGLIKMMSDQYKPVKKMIMAPLKTNCIYRVELRDSTTTHSVKEIGMHSGNLGRLHYDPFLIRAYIRKLECVKSGEAFSEADNYIDQHSTYKVDRMNTDAIEFKKYFSKFTDTELMLTTLNTEKNVLEGVYMFEESNDMKEQIGLILQGSIHNHIQREIYLPDVMLPERPLDVRSIQKALLMFSIFTQETDEEVPLRNRMISFLKRNMDVSAALLHGMNDSKYSYICAVIRLFTQPDDLSAKKILLDRFKDIKNFEESGSIDLRVWSGTLFGTRFKLTRDTADQMNVDLKISECDPRTQRDVVRRLRNLLEMQNMKFAVTVDHEMPKPDYYTDASSQSIKVEYRNHKLILCLANSSNTANVNFFSRSESVSQSVLKWKNCIEFTCNNPIISETSLLWDLIKKDQSLSESIMSTDLTSFTLTDYLEQFQRLEEVVELNVGSSTSKIRSCLMSEPFVQPVIRDMVTREMSKFSNLCPPGIITTTSAQSMCLLQAKLIVSAGKQDDVMSIDNFLRVIPNHVTKVPDIPTIKYKGHPLVGIGKVRDDEFAGVKLMGHNYTQNPQVVNRKTTNLFAQYGLYEEKYFMVFNRDISIHSLFKLQIKDPSSRIMLLDVEQGDVLIWDINQSKRSGEYDRMISENVNLRFCFVCNTKDEDDIPVKIKLEL